VDERENSISYGWDRLEGLATEKQVFIDHDLECEKKKEELRLHFADISGRFVRWEKHICSEAENAHFGFTLDEVAKYAPSIKSYAQEISVIGPRKMQVAKEIFNELKDVYGDKTKNVYTEETLETIEKSFHEVEQSLGKKAENYKAKMTHLRDLDDLCQKLAKLVQPFIQYIELSMTRIAESTQDLNGQSSLAQELLASTSGEKKSKAIVSH